MQVRVGLVVCGGGGSMQANTNTAGKLAVASSNEIFNFIVFRVNNPLLLLGLIIMTEVSTSSNLRFLSTNIKTTSNLLPTSAIVSFNYQSPHFVQGGLWSVFVFS